MLALKRTVGALIIASIASSLLPANAAQAATYYVATTGNNGHTCTQAQNQTTPKLTLAAGVACLAGGDTLILAAGTYSGQIYNPPAGSAGAYTVIKGAAGTPPVIQKSAQFDRGLYCDNGSSCHHIEVRGFDFDAPYDGVKLYGTDAIGYPHHINFIDNIVHDTTNTGWLARTSGTGFQGGSHLIQGNEFYNIGIGTPGYTPGMNTIYNTGNDSIIERNTFHNCTGGVGIWQTSAQIRNVIVRNNRFYDMARSNTDTWQQGANGMMAIHISVAGGGHQIYNNIIYRSGDTPAFVGIRVAYTAANDNSVIYNNTIYDVKHASAHAIWVTTTIGTHLVKNNIAYLGGAGIIGGTQSNNLTTDPSFVDAASADFRLRSGSPAIDKGVTAVQVTVDFAGVRRPQGAAYDIGAYETANGGDLTPPLPPANLNVR